MKPSTSLAVLLLPLTLSTAALAQDTPIDEVDVPIVETVDVTTPRWPILFSMEDSFTVDQDINDLFVIGQDVSVGDGLHDNGFVVAQSLLVEEGETIEGDLFALTQDLEIRGTVKGDVYAFGQVVDVRGHVEGDVYVFSADLNLRPESQINGTLSLGAADANLRGIIWGDVQGGGGNLVLNGTVIGDVDMEAGELVVGSDADISGDLNYSSEVAAAIHDNAHIGGATNFEQIVPVVHEAPEPAPERGFLGQLIGELLWAGWAYAGSLIVGFTLLFLGGTAALRPSRILRENVGMVIGTGLAVACMVPVLSMAAIVTIVPMPLGFIGFAGYAIAIYVARVIAGQALGDAILSNLRPGAVGSPYVSMAVGIAVLTFLTSIPFLGTLVWMAAVTVGFGGMAMALAEARKS